MLPEKTSVRKRFPLGEKVYFLDTSAVMHDPDIVHRLSTDGNIVVFSIHVLFELDKSKRFHDEKGANSREVSRLLDEYRKAGSLNDGVKTKGGGIIVVDCDGNEKYFKKHLPGLERTIDNRIIATALLWKNESKGYKKVAIISKDINLRVSANAFGIESEDYESDKSIKRIEELYTGFMEIDLPNEDADALLVNFPKARKISLSDLSVKSREVLSSVLPNQCLEIKIAGKTILAIYKKQRGELRWVSRPTAPVKGQNGISPKNVEQALLHNILLDEDVDIVTVTGDAGTGKTLITLLAAFEQMGGKKYNRVLVYRPNIEIGPGLGFLPGNIGEKFTPWAQPILDNLSLITKLDDHKQVYGKKDSGSVDLEETTLKYLMGSNGYLEIHPINFIRGRSLNNSFVIVDEVQNLTPHQVKTIITRAGKNTKFVLTGDCTQIDTPYLDPISNGLAYTIERFKGQEIFGNIMLKKGERSHLAELASQLL